MTVPYNLLTFTYKTIPLNLIKEKVEKCPIFYFISILHF